MDRKIKQGLLLLGLVTTLLVRGDALKEMPTPWRQKVERFTYETYLGTLYGLKALYPSVVKLELRGHTPKGLPLYLLKCTDASVADDDKNVILITTFHSGAERTGTAGVFAFLQWLLGPDPLAKESLKKNVLLVMPCSSPEPYFMVERLSNSANIDPYSVGRGNRMNLETLNLLAPEKGPEVVAFQKISDEFHPDIHVDVHGVGMHFNGQIQIASIGRAGSNSALGGWSPEVEGAMFAAGRQAGLGFNRMGGDDYQRIVWAPSMGKKQESFCDMGQPYYYTALYGYFRSHTMPQIIESTWTESVVAPLQGLLKLANRGYSSGPVKDFPVNIIKTNSNIDVVSYGETKAARRESRAGLWKKQQYFTAGSSYSDTANWKLGLVTYGKEGLATVTGSMKDSGRWGQVSFDDLLRNLAQCPYIDLAELKRFLAVRPPAVRKIMFEKGAFTMKDEIPAIGPKEGVSLQLRIPQAGSRLLYLRLNGRSLSPSAKDGYQIWSEKGYTFVKINIPPERFRKEPVMLVSYAWKGPENVTFHYGWGPDARLRQWMQKEGKKDAEFQKELENCKKADAEFRKDKSKYNIR